MCIGGGCKRRGRGGGGRLGGLSGSICAGPGGAGRFIGTGMNVNPGGGGGSIGGGA
jgi:hypothetical protein